MVEGMSRVSKCVWKRLLFYLPKYVHPSVYVLSQNPPFRNQYPQFAPGVDLNQELERMDSEQTELSTSQNLPRNDEDRNPEVLVEQFSRMQLNPEQNRFFGRSRFVPSPCR